MQEEVFDTRDRSYSHWHRRESTRRFIGIEDAQLLAMIDLDASVYVEYDDGTKEPLALIETAEDRGQTYKNATVTRKLAGGHTRPMTTAIKVAAKVKRMFSQLEVSLFVTTFRCIMTCSFDLAFKPPKGSPGLCYFADNPRSRGLLFGFALSSFLAVAQGW